MSDALIRFIADGLVILIVLAGATAYLAGVRADWWRRSVRAFMAGLSALVAAKLLSLLYVTAERPFVTLGLQPKAAYLDNPGFPSDHALFVGVISLIVWYATGNRKLGLLLIVLSLVVGAGRVLALVHTPADVLGGFAAALIGVAPWYIGRAKNKLK